MLKGVWISFFELDFKIKTEEYFSQKISSIFSDVSEKGFNCVFVHVRSHSDAFYKSSIFPISKYVAGKQGVKIDYDPLEIMCYFAKIFNLQIHAWINPFRILSDFDVKSLSKNNPAIKFMSLKQNLIKKCDTGYYYNPCKEKVRTLIVNGVKEIVVKYDVDGIHFDDYFYPTTSKKFDLSDYINYKSSVSKPLSQYDWRRENIDKLIKEVYCAVKKADKNIQFGISPHCSLYYNFNSQFADLEKWIKNKNYIDYIAPQIYFGFETKLKTDDGKSLQFEKCLNFWSNLVKNRIKLYIGLGLYRSGEDGEFSKHNDIISRQYLYALKDNFSDGIIVFSYSSFYGSEIQKQETENLIKILKENF